MELRETRTELQTKLKAWFIHNDDLVQASADYEAPELHRKLTEAAARVAEFALSPLPNDGTLWCVEILGPDDIIATESREVAQAMADRFNRWWRGREDRHPDEPYMEVDVIEWPYDAASHQRELAAAA